MGFSRLLKFALSFLLFSSPTMCAVKEQVLDLNYSIFHSTPQKQGPKIFALLSTPRIRMLVSENKLEKAVVSMNSKASQMSFETRAKLMKSGSIYLQQGVSFADNSGVTKSVYEAVQEMVVQPGATLA